MATELDLEEETEQEQELSGLPSAADDSSIKAGGGPLAILFPPDISVWNESRRLAGDKNIRVEDLATCCSQDPIIAVELLRTANAMYFSGGRSPITTTKTAIVRLGSDIVIETLAKLTERTPFEDEEVAHWFEIHRSRSRRASIIAKILGEALSRTLSDDCQAAGLLLYFGEMLATAHFQQQYVVLAEELSRSGINYRLAQDHRFDVERMGLSYLRRYGIPEALVFAVDREAVTRARERAIMKPICMASAEIVESFDANRWEKLAPGKSLPPKSSVRMLQMSDNQYLKVYEKCSEYLFATRLLEEKKKQQAVAGTLETAAVEVSSNEPQDNASGLPEDSLEAEIEELLRVTRETQPSEDLSTKSSTDINEIDFNLESARTKKKTTARAAGPKTLEPTDSEKIFVPAAKAMASSLNNMLEEANTSEELLSELLQMLVDQGPFEKSALIVVSQDRKKAVVVAARGPNIGNGQTLILEDPLSPLAQCFSKIQSFGIKDNKVSPFGSPSFAVAPIDADHDTPVALYADCGNSGAVTFEARRIFRTVVELLNEKLPRIPGGIPVEI